MHDLFAFRRPDKTATDLASAMCLFWDLEASSSALYERIAARETCPERADRWRRLQNYRLLLGDPEENHTVYIKARLLTVCREAVKRCEANAWIHDDPFPVLTRVMELKTLQVMLLTTLRQQTSLIRMVDLDKFGTCVAFVTRLVLSSRGR
jgi:hypothetical protein